VRELLEAQLGAALLGLRHGLLLQGVHAGEPPHGGLVEGYGLALGPGAVQGALELTLQRAEPGADRIFVHPVDYRCDGYYARMPFPPAIARALSTAIGGTGAKDRAARLHFRDAGHGYDAFGMHPDFVALADALTSPIHRGYFRVRSYGTEHIPAYGPGIMASNHSGTLPLDGMMLWADIINNTDPPRNARAVADYFVSTLPVISTLFARCGVVTGSRGNARTLLEAGELLLIFPEGTPGIGKPFTDRYQLQEWRVGHVELAIRYRAPVVPVGIVGAEEQMPQLARIPMPRTSPVPYLPVPATPLPLPVRYHIHYGEPLRFDREFEPRDADDPELVEAAARRVRDAVQQLIRRGLELREGIFR